MLDITYKQFVDSLSDLSELVADPSQNEELILLRTQVDRLIEELTKLGEISKQSLTHLVQKEPESIPFIASCVGLGRERLKSQLQHRLRTSGYKKLAKNDPEKIIDMLDSHFNLVERVREQLHREWSFADILVERQQWSRKKATSAQGSGRNIEDIVEEVVKSLGLTVKMRTKFFGRGGRSAPCDLAIPSEEPYLIVGAAKGFDSTGSKLSDAVREIEMLADVKLPNQFVFAFIDGIGWKRRESDLRKIFDLWKKRYIDGIYTLSYMDLFKDDLIDAARRLGLL